jgi:DNA polymerase-1
MNENDTTDHAGEKLYLVDAYALIYRAHYAFINAPRVTSSGMNTSAAFGFCNFLFELLEVERPSLVAVVFDPPGSTFRHELYPPYKAQRPPMPEELRRNIPYIERAIDALGIARLSVSGYEADDVIGTLARRAGREGHDVYMITPDKDYAQLVSDRVFMYKPGRSGDKAEILGVPDVLAWFGIERVEQVVDFLGLAGDAADNVPGCVGIGPKGATSLLARYGSIDGIYLHLDELKGKQRENLVACRDAVLLSRRLVTIHDEVPVDVTTDGLARRPVDTPVIEALFRELEFYSLLRRLPGATPAKAVKDAPAEECACLEVATAGERRALLDILLAAPAYAMHATFDAGTARDAFPSALSFAVDPREARYLRLPAGEREVRELLEPFRPLFEDGARTLVTNDAKDDIAWTRRAGIETRNRLFDVKIAHYLLQPDASHELESVALELLDYRVEGDSAAPSPQLSLAFDDGDDDRGRRLAGRAGLLLRLRERLREGLERTGSLVLFEEVEMPLVLVLADMEREGVSVDRQALKEISRELGEKLERVEKTVYELAGREFNINSPRQLGEVLFNEMNVDAGKKKTKTGQQGTSEQVLSRLEGEHPIVARVLEYRGLKKLLTTYTGALPACVNPVTGKIHTRFNQTGAATGRLSSSDTNLQNIPARAEEGRVIRKAFVAGDPDYCFFSADYSQVELRLMAHLSQDRGLIDAFLAGEDVHSATAANIYRVPLEGVTPEMRRRAKMANFGIIYGISAWGLAERLRVSRAEGRELIDGYFRLYPGVKAYMEHVVEQARARGHVETIMGRRRYLPDIDSRNTVARGLAERNAINAPVQGSAADIIKKAMIAIHRQIKERGMKSRMILQVHDELNFACHRDELEELTRLVTGCMEGVVTLSVPLSVSVGHGENWYEAH